MHFSTSLFALALALAATIARLHGADAVVALDGTGDYASIQEAISKAPMRAGSDNPRWKILVKPGVYRERVYAQRERGNILVIGEDPASTQLVYDLHAGRQGLDGEPIGTFRTPTLQIDADGMIWENITIANAAGPVGQALALRVDGDRVAFRNCRFLGWQDTILLNRGRQYFVDCYVEGDVDFIFGGASAYFERCRIHCLDDGYITAASTPEGSAHGFVFNDCEVTAESGVRTYLGRPWREFAQTVFLNTRMSEAVRPEGWSNWNKPYAEATSFYAEYASSGPGAAPDQRVPWAHRLSEPQAARLTVQAVLAGDDGWRPLATTASGNEPLRIALVGDSTVTDAIGWGRGFRHLATDSVEVVNLARNGRSSKSYRAEGHWEQALAERADYYLIQFGHNDQPGKGPDRETDPARSYRDNLARYVEEVRAQGGQPVLVTSLTRRIFDSEDPARIRSTLTPYADSAKQVAADLSVPLIDLHASSIALCESLGPKAAEAFNPIDEGKVDTTHLNAEGSLAFARIVVEQLVEVCPELQSRFRIGQSHTADAKAARN